MNTLISSYTANKDSRLPAYADKRSDSMGSASGSFAQAMLKQGAGGAAVQDRVSAQGMTLEEYKQYILQQIRQIPIHPSRRHENISVVISEEGYAAMKNNPEYEAWVLNDLRSAWSQPSFWFGSTDKIYTSFYYGATKEECHSETWSVPSDSAGDRARARREENRRRLEKRLKKKRLQRQLREIAYQRQERQRALVKKLIEHRLEIEKENRQRWRKEAVKDKPDGSRVLEITTKQKTIEKITERDILRVEEVLWELRMQQEMQRLETENVIIKERGAKAYSIAIQDPVLIAPVSPVARNRN